jgi:carboxymethylenebutenolidase
MHRARSGTIGHCLGGKLAYLAAARAGVDCAVGYYGVGIEGHLNEKDKIRCPMVLHIAGEDKYVPKEAQEQIKADLSAGRPDVEIIVYPGQDPRLRPHHGRPLQQAAADMAHSRSIALFRRVMGPKYDLSGLVGQALRIRVRHPQRRRPP